MTVLRSPNGKIILTLGGKAIKLGAGVTTPTPPADWDALTPYSQVALGWKNANTAALTLPFVTTNHRAQRGDIPPGSRLGLFTASGTEIPSQQDNEAPTHSDGSLASANLTVILPDTLAATGSSGDTKSYFVKAVSGAKNSTPKFTLAAWAAQNDFKIRLCTNLANLDDTTAQYEFRVSDAAALGFIEGTSNGSNDYPLSTIAVTRSGPIAMGWKFKGFARRVSDGAYHRTLVGKFFVTAVSLTDNLVEAAFEMPLSYETGKNAAQTIGPVSGSDNYGPMVGVVQMYRGSTLLRTWGGPTDYRKTAVTIDVANNQAIFATSGLGRSRQSLGYVFTSTGALPSGVVPNKVYWSYQDYSWEKVYFTTKRAFVRQGNAPDYINGHAYVEWQGYADAVVSVGTYDRNGDGNNWRKYPAYYAAQAGTSTGVAPTGTAENQVDGNIRWSPMNLFFGTAGTGTISVYPVVHIFPACGAVFCDDQTADPVWTGSGPAPNVEVIKDVHYLNKFARAFPCYDETLTPLYETGLEFDGYSVSEPPVQATLDAFGDDPGTNLIGYLNVNASNALLNQTSVQVQRRQRAEALAWPDHWLFVDDAKSLLPLVGNAGPGNTAGRYTGLGPSKPGFWFDTYREPTYIGLGSKGVDGNYWDAKYGAPLDGSHLPAFWPLAYEKTARPIFLDQGISLTNSTLLCCYKGGNTVIGGSRNYYNTSLVNQQVRGSGWVTRVVDTLDDVLPAAHPMRAYMTDYIQDGLDFAKAVIEENRVNFPESYATGMMRVARSGPSMQMWMMAYQLTALAQACRKARNPDWRDVGEHLATKLYLPIYDDDVGGSAGLIDWNNFRAVRAFKVMDAVAAGDVFTTQFNYDYGGLNGDTAPSNLTYTAQSGQTPTQVAQAICDLINNTTSMANFGFQATPDADGIFRTNNSGGVFSATNHHGSMGLDVVGSSISGALGGYVQSFIIGKLGYNTSTGLKGPAFSSVPELLEYNLGRGWPQSGTTKLALTSSEPDLQGPDGWVPWDTTAYPNAHWAAMAVMVEAGFPNARKIYDRVTTRIQQTGGGPRFSMVPYSRFSPDGTGRTYNNFNLVAYHLQATRVQH